MDFTNIVLLILCVLCVGIIFIGFLVLYALKKLVDGFLDLISILVNENRSNLSVFGSFNDRLFKLFESYKIDRDTTSTSANLNCDRRSSDNFAVVGGECVAKSAKQDSGSGVDAVQAAEREEDIAFRVSKVSKPAVSFGRDE